MYQILYISNMQKIKKNRHIVKGWNKVEGKWPNLRLIELFFMCAAFCEPVFRKTERQRQKAVALLWEILAFRCHLGQVVILTKIFDC